MSNVNKQLLEDQHLGDNNLSTCDGGDSLAIVVPVLNEYLQLPGILASLSSVKQSLLLCGTRLEIVFVDGGSQDGSFECLQEYCRRNGEGFSVFASLAGRAKQQRLGVLKAKANHVLFLHADTALPADFPQQWVSFRSSGRSWGFFAVKLTGRAWLFRVIERMMSWRSRLTSIATGDQAIFLSRVLYDRVGGVPDLPLMEDVLLCKRCRFHARPWVSYSSVVTSSRRWELRGVCRTVVLMWWVRGCFWLGVPAQTLAAWYRPQQKA